MNSRASTDMTELSLRLNIFSAEDAPPLLRLRRPEGHHARRSFSEVGEVAEVNHLVFYETTKPSKSTKYDYLSCLSEVKREN